MTKIRAKFFCNAVVPNSWGKSASVHFNAVYGTEGENADYSKSTPSGQLNMVIDESTPASTFFERGKSYYLDITEAEK